MHLGAIGTIALVGLPASGKSTVGRQLAGRTQRRFVDVDQEIECRLGRSISSFFFSDGEAAFRQIEARALEDCLGGDSCVLATGGGAVLLEKNRQLLRNHACVVYLHAMPQQLVHRVRNDRKRPLLQVADPLARLEALYALRDPLYRETAQHVIEIGRASLQETLSALLKHVSTVA